MMSLSERLCRHHWFVIRKEKSTATDYPSEERRRSKLGLIEGAAEREGSCGIECDWFTVCRTRWRAVERQASAAESWGRKLFAPKADHHQSVGRQSKRPCKSYYFSHPRIFQIIILTRYYSCTYRPRKKRLCRTVAQLHSRRAFYSYLYIKKKFRLVSSTCPSCRLFSFSPDQFAWCAAIYVHTHTHTQTDIHTHTHTHE